MRTATSSWVLGSMLLLFLATPRSEATAVFDFSGVCAGGDCDPGSTVTGELRFSDDADPSHRDHLVATAVFVSLALGFGARRQGAGNGPLEPHLRRRNHPTD
jgi:hypothetical protein